jgi:hypothetical protein
LSESPLILIFGSESKIIHNKIFVSEKDFLIPYGENYNLAVNELNRIQKSKIEEDSFLSLFSYDDVSIWWMIYPSLMPVINKSINFIYKFQILLDKKKPNEIIVENFDYFYLIKQICDSRKIKLVYSHSSLLSYLLKKKLKINAQKYRYKKITDTKINSRKKLFLKYKSQIPSFNDKIIFITPSSSWRNLTNSKTKLRGESWYNLINLLKQNKDVICIDLDYTLNGNKNILKEKLHDDNFWLPMESMLDTNSFQTEKHNSYIKNYNNLIKQKSFQNLFTFQGFSLWFQLKDFFYMMSFTPYIPLFLKLLDSTKSFFTTNHPNSVFLTYENGSLAQCFIASLIKLNVKTIGAQHGIIYKNNSNYVFDDFYSNNNDLGFPLPDFLLLFGDYPKKILEESDYPSTRLISFGNSFFFDIEDQQEKLQNKNLFKKYGINSNQKIILFTTGRMQRNYQASQGNYDYDEKIWQHLLDNFGGNENYFLILKPHPTEKDIRVYEQMLKKSSFTNAKIIQDDLFELITISFLIVSVFSTTMIDALCFKKNVIQVVIDNVKWPVPIEEYEVALLSNLDELSNNIIKISSDKNLQQSLAKNRNEFLKNQFNIPEKNSLQIIQKIIFD